MEADLTNFRRQGAENDFDYYDIPAGTILYTGNLDHPNPVPHQDFSFFAFDKASAELYGPTYKFVTTEPQTVLAMDSIKTKQKLMNMIENELPTASEERFALLNKIQRILRENYGLETNIRNSEPDQDWLFLTEYLCTLNLPSANGYAIDFMNTAWSGRFHREVAFCRDPHVKMIDLISSPKYIEDWLEHERQKKLNDSVLKSRSGKKRLSLQNNSNSESSNDYMNYGFNSDSDSSTGSKRSAAYPATPAASKKYKSDSEDEEPTFAPRIQKLFDDEDDNEKVGGKRRSRRRKTRRLTKRKRQSTKRKRRQLSCKRRRQIR